MRLYRYLGAIYIQSAKCRLQVFMHACVRVFCIVHSSVALPSNMPVRDSSSFLSSVHALAPVYGHVSTRSVCHSICGADDVEEITVCGP